MCGITGIFSNADDKHPIGEMTKALSHRGPDATGLFQDASGVCSMGHTRLSIIDLSEAANQPFTSADGRYRVAFNGEIYNFKSLRAELAAVHSVSFRTQSDTEVIAEGFSCWGEKLARRLEGMFAIAIFDDHQRTLFLFRDRMGKKPLFYYEEPGFFAFASEIKSLLKHPRVAAARAVNEDAIPYFLHVGYIPEPLTIYRGIRKFPAGNIGSITPDSPLQLRAYWTPEQDIKRDGIIRSASEATPLLLARLQDAVRRRLVSDVPLGAFLSGGVDSALVAGIAAENLHEPLKTFNIGFEDAKFDESRFARAVASRLRTDHTEFTLKESEAVKLLETYLDHFDEPFADTSAIPTMLVSRLARSQVTVALTGDGGDELFLGYGSYRWAQRFEDPVWKLSRLPLQKIFSNSGKSRLERIGALLDRRPGEPLRSHIFSQEQYFFSRHELADDLLRKPSTGFSFYDNDPEAFREFTPAEKQALFDLRYYLRDDLLVKVDRASMFSGLECRCPLLDPEIVSLAFNLDPGLKMKKGTGKWILREVLRKYLPDEMIDRPKWGFSVPLSRWLNNELRYLLDDYLNENILEETQVFNPPAVLELKQKFLSGKQYLYNRLWVVIVLVKWLKDHRV